MVHFCRRTLEAGANPVFFAYSLGKSQELLSGLTGAGLPVMLHTQTLRYTQIYEKLGTVFPPYREFSAREAGGHVVICRPAAAVAFLAKIPARRTAVVSGWALDRGAIYRHGCDAAFPLSDHADFADLLRLVDQVQPQRVLTLHGFAREFAQTLRARGVEAWAVGQDNQLELPLPLLSGLPGPEPG